MEETMLENEVDSAVEDMQQTSEASSKNEIQPSNPFTTLLPRCLTGDVPSAHHSYVSEMYHKLSVNLHHYSNLFQEIASPLISRCSRWRFRSQPRYETAVAGDTIELSLLSGFWLRTVTDGDRGHKFVAVVLHAPTWCDACGRTILGLYRRFLRCKFCLYTCHVNCHNHVGVVCPDVTDSHQSRYIRETSFTEMISVSATADEPSDKSTEISSEDSSSSSSKDLDLMISRFNNNRHGLLIELVNDEFKGLIRVHLNLFRPISMCLSARPPSIYDILTHNKPLLDYKQITSFYLPRDTSTVLHVKDTTTVQEVIGILLQKFNITDDPRKFSLYHQNQKSSKNNMRKLGIFELPLVLCLYWTCQGPHGLDMNKFLLQENDTGDIIWDVFSVPELENFLAMLNREENEYLDRVRSKYTLFRIHLQRRLKQLKSESAEHRNVLDCL